MRTVEQDADAIGETKFDALPERVRDALGELAGAAKEGLLALSVGVGLGVLSELMAEEVDDVVGPKGRHDAERSAVRHGHEPGEVTLGGRRVPVQRPRVRAADGSGEMALATYAHFADRDPLTKVVLEQMLAGVSTRRFARTREPVGQDVVDGERSASKSAVSREFVGRTGEQLKALMNRSLADVRLAALMLDGLELKGRCCVVALGVTTDGVKVPLGLWDGSTENKRVCVELLADLVDRGLDCDQGVLVVLDGGKALRAAVDAVGIVANQPRQLGGILDNDSADKAARFVNLCNAFGIPLVFLQDVPGFMVGTKVEAAGIIRHGAKMLHAVAAATVPKVTVVLRKAYGAGYYVMCGRAYEPDLIVAWPTAEISVMGAEGAVEIVFRREVEAAADPVAKKAELIATYRGLIDVYVAARNDMVDDVIDPRETRPTIIRALQLAEGKRVERPWKRHGVVPV
jgi:hypothetical protein